MKSLLKPLREGTSRLARKAATSAAGAAASIAKKGLKKISTAASSLPDSTAAKRLRKRLPEPDPVPPSGIFYVAHLAIELFKRVESRSIFVLPGGVVFFFLLALFPATAAVSSIYGMVANSADLVGFSSKLAPYLPAPIVRLVDDGLVRLSQTERQSLGLAAFVSVLFTLMSVNWGTKALCEALNIVFDRRDNRSYLEFTAITIIITTTAIMVIVAYAWLSLRIFGSTIQLGGPTAEQGTGTLIVEGLLLWLLLSFLSGTIYRYGPAPDSENAEPIPLLTAGSVFAGIAIIAASWLLARQFMTTGTFVRNFGALSSIAAFVIWAWILVVIILIGAEIVAIRLAEKMRRTKKRRFFRLPKLS